MKKDRIKKYKEGIEHRHKIEKKRQKLKTLTGLLETYKQMNIYPRHSPYVKGLARKVRSVECQLHAMEGP